MVPNKVTRHRESMKAAGYRLMQYWVLDTRSPDLAATLKQQCRSLRTDKTEAESIGFGETAASLIEGWV